LTPFYKSGETSKAGITIHLDPQENNGEPFDITLYIKKPSAGADIPGPDDDNCFTAAGKLLFKFGKRRSLEIFAENTTRVDEDAAGWEEER
jgi:hypothetical protein